MEAVTLVVSVMLATVVEWWINGISKKGANVAGLSVVVTSLVYCNRLAMVGTPDAWL